MTRDPSFHSPRSGQPLADLLGRIRFELVNILRWVQRSLAPENLLAGLKVLSWLAPLTLLIWIYAEREQVVPLDNQPIPIAVRSADLKTYVRLIMDDENVMARLEGPRGRLDDVVRQIQPSSEKASVMLTIPEGHTLGQVHEFDTAQLLGANPIFSRSGVRIVNCKPSRLRVFIDGYEDREFEVQKPAGVTNLVGAPIFDPQRVSVHAPRSVFAAAEQSGPILVEADLPSSGVINVPGPHDVVVRVMSRTLQGDNVTFSPSTVRARFEVGQSDVRYTYPSISVYVTGPRFLLEQYKVECDDTIPNVTVIGPPDKIAELNREDAARPWAVLQVTGDDRPTPDGAKRSRRIRFEVPDPSIRVSSEDAQRTLEFRLVDKSADG